LKIGNNIELKSHSTHYRTMHAN